MVSLKHSVWMFSGSGSTTYATHLDYWSMVLVRHVLFPFDSDWTLSFLHLHECKVLSCFTNYNRLPSLTLSLTHTRRWAKWILPLFLHYTPSLIPSFPQWHNVLSPRCEEANEGHRLPPLFLFLLLSSHGLPRLTQLTALTAAALSVQLGERKHSECSVNTHY